MKIFNFFVFIMATFCHQLVTGNNIIFNPASDDTVKIIEKVYLHTDRNSYYSGDDIWFKAYLIDASYRLLTNHSSNLHVELISPASKIVFSRVIRISEGLGSGDFHLPDEFRTGKYRLRAYTNYMRNFSEKLFFSKEIVVINPSAPQDELSGDIKYTLNEMDISFFPEGGSLVDNVSSLVAFKAVDAQGNGCDVNGKVFLSTGELVTVFKSLHLGMGYFFLRPSPGLNYYCIIKTSDSTEIKAIVPESFSTGLTLSVSNARQNELLITVKTNSQTLPLIKDHDLLLSFSARGTLLKTFGFKIRTFSNNFSIPVDDLPEGIVQLTLSTFEDLPLCQRLIYVRRNKDIRINIEPDRQVYKQRDSVSIKISMAGDSLANRDAFLSFSAAEASFADNSSEFPHSIASWFLLESDVHGTVEEPSYYFDHSNPYRLRDLDVLLLTQGWRDFEWKYNKSDSFSTETGFKISGRLVKLFAKKPLENARVNIGIFKNSNNIITIVPADSSGKFSLTGIDFTGDARLIASAIGNKDHLQGRLFLDSLKYNPAGVSDSISPRVVLFKNDLIDLKQEYEIKNAIRKKYKLSDTINLGEVNIIAKKQEDFQTTRIKSSRLLYETPDDEVIITPQLESYASIIELLRGRVAGVKVEGDLFGSGYKVTIRGPGSIMLDTNPLVLIDGIKGSFSDLVNMSPFLIDRIDILKTGGSTAIFGMEGSNGVISLITKTSGRLTEYKPEGHTVNIKISGYNEPRIFYSPKHSVITDKIFQPDLRTTLFWKPYIRLGNNSYQFINYFNADNSANIRVVVEGITTDGIPVSSKTEYEIR
jgi:hypothetical protein